MVLNAAAPAAACARALLSAAPLLVPPQVGGHLSSTWLLEGNYACSIVTVPRRAAETARSFEPAFGAESESRGAVSNLLPEF